MRSLPGSSQLCDALDYAHTHAKVIHCDLKPANLMVNQRGDLKDNGLWYSAQSWRFSEAVNAGTRPERHAHLHEPATAKRRARHASRRHLLVRRDHLRIAYEQTAVLFGEYRSADLRASCSFDDRAAEGIGYRAGVGSTSLGRCGRSMSGKGSIAASAIGSRGCATAPTSVRTSKNKDGSSARVQRGSRCLSLASRRLSILALAGLYFGVSKRQPKPVSHAPAIPEKSIAVLPFENRSEEKANAYFADGIQDEILTRLSKIADLKVISRTSTQHYKSAPENLPRDRQATWRRPHPGRQRAKERRRRARECAVDQSSQ